MAVTSCWPKEPETDNPILTGRFETELTFLRLEQEGGDAPCDIDQEPGHIEWQTWIIAEENNGYSLTVEDEHGVQQAIGTSNDGYYFNMVLSDTSVCTFSVSFDTHLEYGTTNFTGEHVFTFAVDCPSNQGGSGYCSAFWDVVGRLE